MTHPATVLIVVGGLPGTGKTTLSRGLARRFSATHLRIDTIEQALRSAGVDVGPMGYAIANAVALDNLKLGRPVIADCVNPVRASRGGWRQTAAQASACLVEIELVCSNRSLHRQRVEGRDPDIDGLKLPTWTDVVERIYEPWERDHLVLDTAGRSLDDLLDRADNYVRSVIG